ncbi:MAG: methyltransferase domain-containing protein [Acidimicrobiia bacterium]|nr:methyltransferase domain-containing protein [Acidimicrobiia bacterium]
MVGLTEEAASSQGIPHAVGRSWFEQNTRAAIGGATDGLVKLVFARDDARLLGVHVLGEGATELVHPALRRHHRPLHRHDVQRPDHERGLQVRGLRRPREDRALSSRSTPAFWAALLPDSDDNAAKNARQADPTMQTTPLGRRIRFGSVNAEHLELCSSDDWRAMLRDFIVPWAVASTELGDDVLEVGPGPGMTTDLLRHQVPKLTAVELDEQLAAALTARLAGTNVEIVRADATAMPFDGGRFSAAVSFTMLHHVPTIELQDRLFAEVARVLASGGVFVASDSLASADLAAFHHGDVYNPVDPVTVEGRLTAASFTSVDVQQNDFGWAARARR